MEHHWDWYQVLALKRSPFNCQSNYQVQTEGERVLVCVFLFNIGSILAICMITSFDCYYHNPSGFRFFETSQHEHKMTVKSRCLRSTVYFSVGGEFSWSWILMHQVQEKSIQLCCVCIGSIKRETKNSLGWKLLVCLLKLLLPWRLLRQGTSRPLISS